MEGKDEQSIFPLLQLTTSSGTAPHDMSVKAEPVPVLPKIECHSSMVGRSSGSPPCRRDGTKYSRSCPALSTRTRNSGRSSCSTNGRLYTPVEFEIDPIELPYMGTDYRKIGRVRRVPTESCAIKQNEVQHKTLERKTHFLSRRRDQIQKDYTRTLTLWHMEQERNKNHKDPAHQRRVVRILNFIDKMVKSSDKFHFKEGFFLDLMDPEYFPEPCPSPINLNRTNSKRPIINPPNSGHRSRSSGHFRRRDSKTEALEAKFSDCKRAGDVQGYGYVYVKIHTDPYYRYLPPLSDASKNFTVRLARLPHKRLRNEEQWRKFLDSLRPKTPPPSPPKPKAPTIQELKKARTEELKKKLPIISLLPKWLREVRDKNDIRTARYKSEEEQPGLEIVETGDKDQNSGKIVNTADKDNSGTNENSQSLSRPGSRKKVERRKSTPIGITITESHTKADMNGVISTLPKLSDQRSNVITTPETPIKHRIRASR